MRRFIVGLGESVSNVGVTVAAVCLIAIVVINGANVTARYLFSAPFSWAEEAMIYIMIAGVFWGAITVAWREIDIRIDAFVNRATGSTRLLLRFVAGLVSIAILSWLLFVSCRVAIQLGTFNLRSTALNLPMWIPNAAFASGLCLAILMMIFRLFVPSEEPPPTDQTLDKRG